MSKNRKQILIPLAVTLALLTIGAVICLAAIDVGSGAPNEGLTSRFQNAFFRNGFAYLVSLPPVNNVQRFGSTGLIQEFNSRESAGTGGTAARADQQEKGTRTLSELDMETPEGDAIEQHQEVIADEAGASPRREVPFDVNEADAAEQERAVGFDDDDYR